ncbi:MAG: Bro-N domain-containing protein [Roseovarius sp.]
MQYAMQVFHDEDDMDFRVIDRDGEPWFVLADVCRKLAVVQPASASRHLDTDEKGVLEMHTPGGRQKMTVINESGLYSLVLRSSKPEAKRFKKWVTSEVLPSIRKTGSYGGRVPAFIKRFNENWDRVEHGYFSVINELVYRLWGRLEMVGHIMADRAPDGKQIRPDNSVGRLFAKWLEECHPEVCGEYKFYSHKTDEWEGDARMYPRALLPLFIEFVDDVWIPEHSERYFNTRDPAALPYLPKLLPSPKAAE